MWIAYWILAGVLALAALGAGALKLLRSREALAAAGQGWVQDFRPVVVKAIGAAEVLGGVGVILPMLLAVAPLLAPIAALGLALLQAGAFVLHARRGASDRKMLPVNMVLFALAGAVAVIGFFLLA